MTRFGDALRRERTKKGRTLRNLARACGLSPAFLSDIELGRRFPSLTSLGKINKVLRCALNLREHRCPACGQIVRD